MFKLFFVIVLSAAHFSAAASPSKYPIPQFSATLTTEKSAAPATPPFPYSSAEIQSASRSPVSCYSGTATTNTTTAPAPADPPHFSAAVNSGDFESLATPSVRLSAAVAKLAGVGSPANPPVTYSSAEIQSASRSPVSCYSGIATTNTTTAPAPAPADPPHFSAAVNSGDFESLATPSVRLSAAVAKLAGVGSPANPPVPHPTTSDSESNSSLGYFRAFDPSAASRLPDDIWENILLRLGPAEQFYGQFVCRLWRSMVSPNIEAFRNHVDQINSKESRKKIYEIERLLKLLTRTESNLEQYSEHPLGKEFTHFLLVERFLADHPDIVPKDWDLDKMNEFYVDQIKFKVEVAGHISGGEEWVQQYWVEKDFLFQMEAIERKITKETNRNKEIIALFGFGMIVFYLWPAWTVKKDRLKAKGKKGCSKNGKKGKDGKKGRRKG